MTFRHLLPFVFLLTAVMPAAGQDQDTSSYTLGSDRFSAGAIVSTDGQTGLDDVFLTGATVELDTAIDGDAFLLGSTVTVSAPVAGDVYGAGAIVDVNAPVAGDLTVMGQTIRLTAPVTGDVRLAGQRITLDAPIAGNALLAGEEVILNSIITGDVTVGAESLTYGPEARIDGVLTLSDRDDIVPEAVSTRVTITESRFEPKPDLGFAAFLLSVVIRAAIVAGIIMAANVTLPRQFATWEMRIVDNPERALGDGFLTMAMLIGAMLLLAITLIGLVAMPVFVVLIGFGWIMGYIFGGYGVAALIWDRLKQPLPQTVWGAGMMGAAGAAVMMLLAKIPYVGWLVVVLVVLTGIGAVMSARMDRLRGRG
ncbi:hypothetical protein FHS89_000086 [Rubricella aquisinus]|uniref:DUF8173 domain-containing protein n=1 Tax=Rubricella aquisinus TaxID=2028108 RepID=A0A840WG04_9RHOB|nr:hypothetical protein [Rubricella aquisinus]MBB5514088.1 hypothetical protein [Rubricella aquisinus]